MWCRTVANTTLRYIKKYRNNRSKQSVDGAVIAKGNIQF